MRGAMAPRRRVSVRTWWYMVFVLALVWGAGLVWVQMPRMDTPPAAVRESARDTPRGEVHEYSEAVVPLEAWKKKPCPPPTCTMQTCADMTRCAGGFSIFVAPTPRGLPVSGEYADMLAAFRSSAYATQRAEDACVLVSGVDTMCLCNNCDEVWYRELKGVNITRALRAQHTWARHGRNHVVVEMSDRDVMPYCVDDAILARSNMLASQYRAGFDLSVPLYQKVWFETAQRHVPPSQRELLLTFKGARYAWFAPVRNRLHRIHNGRDVLMITKCFLDDHQDNKCDRDAMFFDSGRYDYMDMAVRSKFCLVPEGVGKHSYRMLEVMSAGCIPVIVADDYILPLHELVPWDDIALRVPERDLLAIPTRLRAMSAADMDALHARMVAAYERYFITTERMYHTVLDALRLRFEYEQ